ncbi:MAG: family 10 glycosylhydrolase [Oscillospiraceae bacterium]|nr:family 10 glycosylhydrolase [Oscillospiraceae bacterium]
MKLIINEDNSHFYYQIAGKSIKGVDAFIDQYENTGVTELFLNVNSMRASYDSKAFEPIWKGYDPTKGLDQPYFDGVPENERLSWNNWPYNALELNGDGKNVYCDWIARCREKKISPWISMRMNDVHCVDNEPHPINSDFWREHPEFRRVNYKPSLGWVEKAFDYGHKEVREYHLNLIREFAELFDMDGLELDWMRFGYCFKPGFEQEGAKLLNQFTRDVRKILDDAEQKRGHKIGLAARVPSRPATALNLGYDAVTWAIEGLIDLLVVTPFWATAETDMPIEIWKQLLRGTKTKLAAGIEVLLQAYSGAKHLFNGIETLRGTAWSYINRGVDAVYLFNYMHTGGEADGLAESIDFNTEFTSRAGYDRVLNETGDIEAMRGKCRRHVVTYADTWAPGEPVAKLLPGWCDSGIWNAFRVHIGEAPNDASVVISVDESPAVYVNGIKCEKSDFVVETIPVPPEKHHSYKIPVGVLHDGYNIVETFGGKGSLIWVEIFVTEELN